MVDLFQLISEIALMLDSLVFLKSSPLAVGEYNYQENTSDRIVDLVIKT
jgi:hypothetical protein